MLFAIAFWVASMPAMWAPENITYQTYPPENVINGGALVQYPAITSNTISSFQLGTYNAYFYIWLGLLGFMFLMLVIWYVTLLRNKSKELMKAGGDVMEKFEDRW